MDIISLCNQHGASKAHSTQGSRNIIQCMNITRQNQHIESVLCHTTEQDFGHIHAQPGNDRLQQCRGDGTLYYLRFILFLHIPNVVFSLKLLKEMKNENISL